MRKTNSAAAIINRLKGKRWNARDAGRILEILERSGESLAGFARRHGIKDQRLIWWRRRLGPSFEADRDRSTVVPEPAVQFVPMVGAASSAAGSWSLSCVAAVNVTDDGFRIEIHDAAVPATWVSDLARGLRKGDAR